MTILSECVLTESKSARDNQLDRMSHDSAQSILNRIKSLYFALWKGLGTATTNQMAEFYEVPTDSVQKVIQRHRDELESDGLKIVKGKELKALASLGMDSLSIPDATTIITVWTPRAALRLGMLLRDSTIAKTLRTSLLDAVEYVIPASSQEIERLKLELELARAREGAAHAEDGAAKSQERLIAVSSAIATMYGSGMVALILGKPDAVVERVTEVEKTILCNERGQPIKAYKGLSKTKLAKRYGMKKAADVENWLKSIGKADALQPAITAAPCQYVPFELVPELDRLWASRLGVRQRLIGE